MKKTTSLFFVALLFSPFIVKGQNLQMRNKIVSTYNLRETTKILTEKANEALENKKRAINFAQQNGLVISGINRDGGYFELDGIDENGILLYKRTFNSGSRITSRVEEVNAANGILPNLDGNDMIAGVVDGEVILDTQQDLLSERTNNTRVFLRQPVSKAVKNRSYEEKRLHATHVAGTIASNGKHQKMSKGMAPKASIWSYSWDGDIKKMGEMAGNGILVSNHSYGYDFFDELGNPIPNTKHYYGSYIEVSANFDWLASNYKYYIPVVAAGNDGRGQRLVYKDDPEKINVDMLTGASVAKNAVVVAAVKEVLDYQGPEDVVLTDFSSQGPTNDFRIKPDIAAKGNRVFSTSYKNPENSSIAPKIDEYAILSGTSMAAPAVTGVFTLWQQWAMQFSKDRKAPFKSATIRAIMAHTADEAGIAPGPDHLFGWGLINALAGVQVMDGSEDEKIIAFIEENSLENSEVYTKEIEITEPGKLVFTLAWTDIAGDGHDGRNSSESYMLTNPILVNDLDIEIRKDDKVYYPWKLNKDFSDPKAIKGNNDVDNIEKIEIDDAEPGKYEVVISHKKSLKNMVQEYSLVITAGEFNNLQRIKDKEEIKEDKLEYKLWPNPMTNFFFAELGEKYEEEIIEVKIFDLNSRLVRDYSIRAHENGTIEVSVEGLTSSIYFVEIKAKGLKKQMRVIKQ